MGTCFTALLASAGTGVNARRMAALHLLINVAGTVGFLVLGQLLPLAALFEGLAPGATARQIAHVHTLFNVVSSAVLLPVGGLLVKAAAWLVPKKR